jgi:GT2 family glycosyltransferase
VSVIVPLYGRHDFVDYQMAVFADDPDFKDLELIYVVDDPRIYDELRGTCPGLFGLYQVPFSVAFPGVNLGFAGANNFGVEYARGQHLLFLNSDVLPKKDGWVAELLRIYKSTPGIGLLGAKLLYEDGSLQHAGIAFERYAPWGELWINDHPLKGQSPAGLTGVQEVDAVTAACVLMEASLFRQFGGFSEDYVVGDFEDSDLCLKALAAGRKSMVALDVELFHLERQSQAGTGDALWRANLTAYNCWVHNTRWSSVLNVKGTAHEKAGRHFAEKRLQPNARRLLDGRYERVRDIQA